VSVIDEQAEKKPSLPFPSPPAFTMTTKTSPHDITTSFTMTMKGTFLVGFCLILSTTAFQPPSFGIGAVLFPVRGREIDYVSELERSDKRNTLYDASDFFVDAFWTGKVGGGSKQLSESQRRSLLQSQEAEFTRRYGSYSSTSLRPSELVVIRSNDEVVGCVGVEVDSIPDKSLGGGPSKPAPLMSNLAVSRKFRRRGLAEELVQRVEVLVKSWGFDECYLYVEERNRGAVNLYKKLGYKTVWKDREASTLMPTTRGSLVTADTVLICMKKNLKPSLWQSLFR
jgi:ribosomal protein S18 acetylase RimI-like enzyme